MVKRSSSLLAKRILIIDDEKDITVSLKAGLEEYGFGVDTYNDPYKAVSDYTAGVYDIIVLDIRMPGLNGFEVSRELRKKEPKVRIWFLTAFDVYKQEFDKLFPDLSIQRFIHKPITASNLTRLIKQDLEERVIQGS
jgi:two-component system catabolic regulation response regulator CreB/two-component system response regulator ChvI